MRKTRGSGKRNNSHSKCAFIADAGADGALIADTGLALFPPTLIATVNADACTVRLSSIHSRT
ncbi:hypothetical protein I6J24_08800 [Corynebacterium kroppenstedtii]|nr:hypothetical protein I6J24_08800 [Corynebacterium kroppenstedtii]